MSITRPEILGVVGTISISASALSHHGNEKRTIANTLWPDGTIVFKPGGAGLADALAPHAGRGVGGERTTVDPV